MALEADGEASPRSSRPRDVSVGDSRRAAKVSPLAVSVARFNSVAPAEFEFVLSAGAAFDGPLVCNAATCRSDDWSPDSLAELRVELLPDPVRPAASEG